MPGTGKTISRYRIVEKIGQGGMGEVYLADDATLDRKAALKFLPEAFAGDPERMARFEREARLPASLNHPNIAGIYAPEQADGKRFPDLEHVEGETLQARLSEGALQLEDALALCRRFCAIYPDQAEWEETCSTEKMPVSGSRLGPYEILSHIGAGGLEEV